MPNISGKKLSIQILEKLAELDEATLTFHNSLILDEVKELLRSLTDAGEINLTSPNVLRPPLPSRSDVERSEFREPKFQVMVVDDDDDIIRLLKFSLRGIQAEVIPFKEPRKALAQITTVKPDLILLDILMPQMTGFEFMDAMKEKGITGKFKVIVASAKHSRSDKILALEKGAIDYLEKPYDIQELRMRIEKLREESSDVA